MGNLLDSILGGFNSGEIGAVVRDPSKRAAIIERLRRQLGIAF